MHLSSYPIFRYFKSGTVLNSYADVLAILMRLRQLCCHPKLCAAAAALSATESKFHVVVSPRADSLIWDIALDSSRADLGVGPSGLLNISALHVQYGIQAFGNFKRPECTRLHLRGLQSKNFPGRACARNSLEKCAVRSPDGHYRAHIATVDHISKPPLSQNPPSAPVLGGRLRETAKRMRLTFSRRLHQITRFFKFSRSESLRHLERQDICDHSLSNCQSHVTFTNPLFLVAAFPYLSVTVSRSKSSLTQTWGGNNSYLYHKGCLDFGHTKCHKNVNALAGFF